MTDIVEDAAPRADAPLTAVAPELSWALAGMSAGAGVIHFAMTPIHAGTAWQEAFGFAAAGWFQLVTAALIVSGRTSRRLLQLVVLANLAFIGVYIWSRTAGLPFGETPNVAEEVGAIDAACVALQVGVIAVGARLLLAPAKRSIGRLAPTFAGLLVFGLVTAVVTSPDVANHGHGDQPSALELAQQEVDETRCDKDVNPASYYKEADQVGVDTRWAGAPPVGAAATSSDGHSHGAAASADPTATTSTMPDPNEGRGSAGLDELVSATSLAATSEGEAARLVVKLSHASQDDYEAWLAWLQTSGSLAHEHSASTSAEDGSGHGGHVGPQPWKALTDPKQCEQLHKELDLARETAMSYPTAQDAMDDGYQLVTGYVPGIAAHFIKYSLIDGRFEIDKPEMILYDGNGPEAHVVGLSYYLWHAGDAKPTQGFTGENDSAHRHIGLCNAANGRVIGDSATTADECEARGGSKAAGDSGWMSHAWVVPGCESPWGVFSAASPVLDDSLGNNEDGGPGCAASGVRERYAMGDAPDEGESAAGAKGDSGD